MRGLKPTKERLRASGQMSHPIRVRGLKHPRCIQSEWNNQVASYTGAWIETPDNSFVLKIVPVASYTGAWIETGFLCRMRNKHRVASYTGAWIET